VGEGAVLMPRYAPILMLPCMILTVGFVGAGHHWAALLSAFACALCLRAGSGTS
jgi:hypothetical protein